MVMAGVRDQEGALQLGLILAQGGMVGMEIPKQK